MASISQSPPSSIAARLEDCVFAIRKRIAVEPRVGIVLGSGLGAFADSLEGLVKIPYGDLPHMPASDVVGHAGNLCFGEVGGTPVVCMQGRVHLYEGHPVDKVVHGVRTMARLGVRSVLLTNAAGGLDPTWAAGDLMVVSDHLNLTGVSPLVGPDDDDLGPRFPDMTAAYDPELRVVVARRQAAGAGVPLREGVYAGLLGPQYETPAEIRMIRDARRGRRRHEHGARGDRAPSHGRARRGALLHHQPGRRDLRPSARSRRGRGDRAIAAVRSRRAPSGMDRARRSGAMSAAPRLAAADRSRLLAAARAARAHAYAPYSHYRVGAALLTRDGSVYAGCNVENATYGATMCAERSAVAAMITDGKKDPIACAVVTVGREPAAPCGICRQVLAEFAQGRTDMKLVLVADDARGRLVAKKTARLSALLPQAFRFRAHPSGA